MAVGNWTFYSKFKKNIGSALVNFAGGNFKMALYTSASNAATTTLSIISSITNECAAANGYVAGGLALTKTWTSGASAGQWRFNISNVVWTGTGGTISNIKFAVIYTSGASATVKKLICYSQLSTAQFNLTINNTLTIQPSATGIFNLA